VEQALSLYNLGQLHFRLGEPKAAWTAFEQAVAVQKQLASDFPREASYRHYLSSTHERLGYLLMNQKEYGAALAAYEQAIALQKQLVHDFPEEPDYRVELSTTLNSLGMLWRDRETGRPWSPSKFPKEAQAAFEQAAAVEQQLVQEYPAVPDYRLSLSVTYNQLGILWRRQGERGAARAAYEQALAVQQRLVRDFPKVPSYRLELGASYGNLANLTRDGGQPAEALEWHAKALATVEPVLAQQPRLAQARRYACFGHTSRARTLDLLKRHAEAARDWGRAIELNDDPSRDAEFRRQRALSLARAGEHAQAVVAANELAAAKGAKPDTLLDCARVCSLAAVGVKDDPGLRERYAVQAVVLLRQALAAGYQEPARLRQDRDFEPLRERKDFQKLFAEQTGPGKP
jgi:tetratricopeptide (TPR) repeat protein